MFEVRTQHVGSTARLESHGFSNKRSIAFLEAPIFFHTASSTHMSSIEMRTDNPARLLQSSADMATGSGPRG